MIKYISTRGSAPTLSFAEVVLTGLASDGGLYVPETIPTFTREELQSFKGLSYSELAYKVMQPFIGDAIAPDALRAMINDAYATFRHPDVAPLTKLSNNQYLLELFHGPTLAFKDFALQLLGRMVEYFVAQKKEPLTVIGATSGDTGSAAIAGFQGRKNMRIFILHPEGRVSDVQRRQMTSVADANVYNIALDGTFDDCQNIVKALFADSEFRTAQQLTAVNSINWARILAQVVYYFYAALKLDLQPIAFSVPTGNFGDIYAGYIAKRMGLPIEKLIIATNSNDILARCLKTGIYGIANVYPTISPSMDIQVSSNFERLLFDLYDRNGDAVKNLMDEFASDGLIRLSPSAIAKLRESFAADKADEATTKATIATIYRETGQLLDPHTAVGVTVGTRLHRQASPLVMLATAHPAKFPDAVEEATSVHPALPAHLSDLSTRAERMQRLPNDVAAVKHFIEK